MKIYRITTEEWAGKLKPSGFAGRWNFEGDYVLYASEHRSLACLENLVHRSGNPYAGKFYITEILIPDSVIVERPSVEVLLNFRNTHGSLIVTREFGHQWYSSFRNGVLKVPSGIVPQESNYVINTRHQLFAEIRVGLIEPFELDPGI
ncbi:MAG: hypothetical protein AMXMBFR48_19310 [Ignavibacteriales bacterium]